MIKSIPLTKLIQSPRNVRRHGDPADNHAAICTATLGPGATPLGDALGALARDGRIETPELMALQGLWPDSLATPVDRLVHRVIQVAGLRDWCDRLDDPAQMRADLLRFEAEAAAFLDAHRDMREASGFYGQSANVFLGWLENKVGLKGEDLRPNPAGAEADGIEILTWHASKGREWPVVVVCGLDHCQTAFKRDPRSASKRDPLFGYDVGLLRKALRCVRRRAGVASPTGGARSAR